MTQDVKIIIGIIAATIVILIGGILLTSGKSASTTPDGSIKIDQAVLIKKDSYSIGPSNAKVTIVEFGDYQCPVCGTAYPITKEVLKNYQGKIRFVYRNFPLSQHQNAMIAAEAAEAAGAQGKFWEMHDMLFQSQSVWGESTKPLDYFTTYAKNLKLNVTTFTDAINANKFQDKIQADVSDGNTASVNGTPTFFINNIQYTGDLTYDGFKQVIDAKL